MKIETNPKWTVCFCVIALLMVLAMCNAASAKEGPSLNNVLFLENYDADTMTFAYMSSDPFFRDLYENKLKVRLYGIDTPELKTKSKCEKDLSIKAKEFVRGQLVRAAEINLEDCFHGKFAGRVVCSIKYRKRTKWYYLTGELIKKGYGVAYFGKKKQKTGDAWCE